MVYVIVKEPSGKYSAYLDQKGSHQIMASDLSEFNMRNFLMRKGHGPKRVDEIMAAAIKRNPDSDSIKVGVDGIVHVTGDDNIDKAQEKLDQADDLMIEALRILEGYNGFTSITTQIKNAKAVLWKANTAIPAMKGKFKQTVLI